jgi:hypothetical protein
MTPLSGRTTHNVPFAGSVFLAAFVVACSIGAGHCNVDAPGGGIENPTCLGCHDGRTASDMGDFPNSPHRGLRCESCHGSGYLHVRNGGRGGSLIENPGIGTFAAQAEFCGTCHEEIVTGFMATPHGAREAVGCNDCHDVHRTLGFPVASASPASLDIPGFVSLCEQCHGQETGEFLQSGHATADVATCASCHDLHAAGMLTASAVDNSLCQQCHASFELGFDTVEAIETHVGPFHPVDPAGSGSSRCTACHLPPTILAGQPDVPHDHTLFTVPPSASNDSLDQGGPVIPNSCSGVMGCHDPGVAGSGSAHDPSDRVENTALQALFDSIGEVPDTTR